MLYQLCIKILNYQNMASVEVAAPVGLVASEEQVKAANEAVKLTEIEPTTEKVTEEEAPAEEVPATEKAVNESPAIVEKSEDELTVTLPVSEPEAKSVSVESEEAAKPKEEVVQVPELEAEPTEEVSVVQTPEAAAVEEKAEESSVKEEAPAEVPEEKTASVEESAVQEAKPAEAAPAEEKAEGEGKGEE